MTSIWNPGGPVTPLELRLASAIGAGLVGFNKPGGGTVQQQLDMLYYGLANIRDTQFAGGAKGDGVTNDSAALQAAVNSNKTVFGPPGNYYIPDLVQKTGKINLQGVNCTFISDTEFLRFTDAAGSVISGDITCINKTMPWTIQRDTVNWTSNVPSDVTQSNLGYQPSASDGDIYSGLSSAIQLQDIGPKIVFTSSSSIAQSGVDISGLKGRFLSVILEGYINSTVHNNTYKAGKDYAGVVFYNGVNISRLTGAPMLYSFAPGVGNTAPNNIIDTATTCGITFFGNSTLSAQGNIITGCGESGIKTYQKDATFGDAVICTYGTVSNNLCSRNRFDGIDVSATYPTTGTRSGHNKISNNICRGNRATGIFSDAQSNTYAGNDCLDNGLGGMTIQAANCKIDNNYLENNVKFPGILGAFNSYDLDIAGDNCDSMNNTVRRSSAPAYTNAMSHIGNGGCSVNNSIPFPVVISPSVYINVVPSQSRITKVPTSFVNYFITNEPASIQSVIKLGRTASEGVMVDILQGAGETRVGSIAATTTSTAYNTSSDYRLKIKKGPVTTSGSFIDSIKVYNILWKVNQTPAVATIAHELQEISPSSVTGVKDEVDAEGNPIHQGVYYGSPEIICNIIVEIQELRKRVKQLELK